MADQAVLSITVDGTTKTATLSLAPLETNSNKMSIAPEAADVEVALPGVTNPKLIAVLASGVGITVRRTAATGTPMHADPFYCECCSAGFAQASIFISNSGSQPVTVTVLAAE
jgi:hypothetical protein